MKQCHPNRPWCPARALAAGLIACAVTAAEAQGDEASGELRLRAEAFGGSATGPLAAAQRLQPGIAPPAADATTAELRLKNRWRLPCCAAAGLSVEADALASWRHDDSAAAGSATQARARLNELHLAADLGEWQASIGRKIVSWDVGHAFRPNDSVQQERRRTLLPTTLEGRPVAMLERFKADSAWSLAAVHPTRTRASRPPSADARDATRETALAARAYGRHGSADVHGFLRWGRHTGPSAGSAVSWVGSDSTELHASVRILRRHVAWTLDPAAGTAVVAVDPWARQLRGPRAQALIGLQWTGQNQFGLLAEAWYDGTAPSVGEWRAWSQRLTALSASGAPAPARAGNLAWQATGFDRDNLHRLNVYLRLSWQAGGWQLYTDVLTQPADQGRQHTAGLQWQGNRLRLEAALRNVAGPADAVLHQLPVRRSAAMAATWSF